MRPSLIVRVTELSTKSVWVGDWSTLYSGYKSNFIPCPVPFEAILNNLFNRFSPVEGFLIEVSSLTIGRQEAWGDRSWRLTQEDYQAIPKLTESYYSIGD